MNGRSPDRGRLRDWLVIFVALLDDLAVALVLLLVLWLLKVPISAGVIALLAVFFVGLAFIMHRGVIPVLRRPVATGVESMIGLEAKVTKPLTPEGLVMVNGECWAAECRGEHASVGETVRIVAVTGLRVTVKRL
jgi:membrane-bound ClpP family serine protease